MAKDGNILLASSHSKSDAALLQGWSRRGLEFTSEYALGTFEGHTTFANRNKQRPSKMVQTRQLRVLSLTVCRRMKRGDQAPCLGDTRVEVGDNTGYSRSFSS